MKIWLMNHYATSMFKSRMGRHYWFARKLKDRGLDVTVFCANTFQDSDDIISTEGRKSTVRTTDGIPFVFVKTFPYKGNGISRVKNMYYFYKNLFPAAKDYVKENGKPDVIVASSVHPLTLVAGIQIAHRMRIPCICEVRDLWPEAIFSFGKAREKSLLGRILIAGEHWIYRKSNALIFTKEGDTDYLKEKGWLTEQGGDIPIEKCYYINNGVNLHAYEQQIKTEVLDDADLLDDTKFNVVYAGTIRPVNNIGNLLDCAAIIKERGYGNIRFLIYGDGFERQKLEQRVVDENLDNVKMKGFVNRSFMPYVLSKSSVNILNYAQNLYNWTRGNSSNKLFEYMASGKPVISTVKMGYSIIDKYQCGVELDKDTPEALADAIIRFYDMSDEEYNTYGSNAREGAKEFDFDVLTARLMDVIESVV